MRTGRLVVLVLVIAANMPSIAVGEARAQEMEGKQSEACSLPMGWDPAEDLPRILKEHREWVERFRENVISGLPAKDVSEKWKVKVISEQWAKDHPEGRANLCNADLRRTNLTKADLRLATLTGAYLLSATLIEADLRLATFAGAKLHEAILTKANLLWADLTGADLQEVDLTGANLFQADLTGANLREANLTEADLQAADLHGADLTKAKLIKANLPVANLGGVKLGEANLTGAYLFGATLTEAHLYKAILTKASLSAATLTGAYLSDATLTEVNLSSAALTKADLHGADLHGADLREADLREADLREADLREVDLTGATLTKANLREADLTEATLTGANLSEADLTEATLTGANLSSTNLLEIRLAFANLTGATYAPASPPPDPYLEGIKGLSTVIFPEGSGSGLVQLRELLQKAGLRDLERQATYAIENNKTRHSIASENSLIDQFEAIFKFTAFELTTGYGLYPSRALLIIFWIGALLIPVYTWAIFRIPHWLDSPGIYCIWSKERIEASAGRIRLSDATDIERVSEQDWRAITWAAYFSLLSAFHIGFRDFNVGNWIARIQADKYTLEPTGWVRIVSGLQSLLSVYLLAIWALTYFGRPFQ